MTGIAVLSWTHNSTTACTTYRYYLVSTNAVGDSSAGGILTTSSKCFPQGHFDSINGANNPGPTSFNQYSTITLNGWAADNEQGSPVTKVEIYAGATLLGNATLGVTRTDVGTSFSRSDWNSSGWTYSWSVGSFAAGTYAMSAKAYDSDSNVTTLSWGNATVVQVNPPSAASGLNATSIYSSSLVLNWVDNATNETAYRVYQCTGNTTTCASGPWSQRGTDLAAGTLSLSIPSLTGGTTYTYKVTAVGAAGNTDSALYQVTTMAIPPQVTVTAITPQSNGTSIKIDWTPPGGTANMIGIHYCVGAACGTTWTNVYATDRPATDGTWTHTGLTPGTVYYYNIFSFNNTDNPIYYNGTQTFGPYTTPDYPGTPSITVIAIGSKVIRVTWPDVSGETIYSLERCQGSGCSNFTVINSSIAAGTTSYDDPSLTPATAYTYRLTATNAVGSRQSNTGTSTCWARMRPR